jgi:hypothetical protein
MSRSMLLSGKEILALDSYRRDDVTHFIQEHLTELGDSRQLYK